MYINLFFFSDVILNCQQSLNVKYAGLTNRHKELYFFYLLGGAIFVEYSKLDLQGSNFYQNLVGYEILKQGLCTQFLLIFLLVVRYFHTQILGTFLNLNFEFDLN